MIRHLCLIWRCLTEPNEHDRPATGVDTRCLAERDTPDEPFYDSWARHRDHGWDRRLRRKCSDKRTLIGLLRGVDDRPDQKMCVGGRPPNPPSVSPE
ncbi:hypothetical protein BN903_117 [Halorubrum sp. AJ67]|nr:hypothetical protein BN903_117 [Halorubrum sp. AJ67]